MKSKFNFAVSMYALLGCAALLLAFAVGVFGLAVSFYAEVIKPHPWASGIVTAAVLWVAAMKYLIAFDVPILHIESGRDTFKNNPQDLG